MECDDILDGRYRLARKLGGGRSGEVWEVFDERVERSFALKILNAPGSDAAAVARLAATAGGLSHPHVVTVHDHGETVADGHHRAFLVMELLTGRTLDNAIAANPPALPQAVEWAAQICAALHAAHQSGVPHGALTPHNIIVSEPLETLKVLDFAVAAAGVFGSGSRAPGDPWSGAGAGADARAGAASRSGARAADIAGIVPYLAPERITGGPADIGSDLYALGCVLMELFTGQPPFPTPGSAAPGPHKRGSRNHGSPAAGGHDRGSKVAADIAARHRDEQPPAPSTLRQEIPYEIDRVILDLLEKDPGHRPVAAARVRQRLLTAAARAGHGPSSNQRTAPAARISTRIQSGTPHAGAAATSGSAVQEDDAWLLAVLQRMHDALALQDASRAVTELQSVTEDLAAARGRSDRQTLGARAYLADRVGKAGDPQETIRQLTAVVADATAELGSDDRDTLEYRRALADWTGHCGRESEAVDQFTVLIKDAARVLGADDRETLLCRSRQAFWSPPGEALRMYYELVPHLAQVLGGTARETMDARHCAARCYWESGQLDEALRQMYALASDSAFTLGDHDPLTLERRAILAHWMGEAGDPGGAVNAYHALVPDLARGFGVDARKTLEARVALAYWTGEAGAPQEAVAQYRMLLPDLHRVLGTDDELVEQAHAGMSQYAARAREADGW